MPETKSPFKVIIWPLLRCLGFLISCLQISGGISANELPFIVPSSGSSNYFSSGTSYPIRLLNPNKFVVEDGGADGVQYRLSRDGVPSAVIPLEDFHPRDIEEILNARTPQDMTISYTYDNVDDPLAFRHDFGPAASNIYENYAPQTQDDHVFLQDVFDTKPQYVPVTKTSRKPIKGDKGRRDDDDLDLESWEEDEYDKISDGDRFGYSDRFYNLKSYTHREIFDRTKKKFAYNRKDWDYGYRNYQVHKYKHHPLDKYHNEYYSIKSSVLTHPLDKYEAFNKQHPYDKYEKHFKTKHHGNHEVEVGYKSKLKGKYYYLKDKLNVLNGYKHQHSHGWPAA